MTTRERLENALIEFVESIQKGSDSRRGASSTGSRRRFREVSV